MKHEFPRICAHRPKCSWLSAVGQAAMSPLQEVACRSTWWGGPGDLLPSERELGEERQWGCPLPTQRRRDPSPPNSHSLLVPMCISSCFHGNCWLFWSWGLDLLCTYFWNAWGLLAPLRSSEHLDKQVVHNLIVEMGRWGCELPWTQSSNVQCAPTT